MIAATPAATNSSSSYNSNDLRRTIFAWTLLIAFVAFIYATLGSLPAARDWLELHYGKGIFATVTYLGAGFGVAWVLAYLIFRKKERRLVPYLSLVFIGLFLRHAMQNWITIPVEQVHFIEYGGVGFLSYHALKHHLRGWGLIAAAFLLSYLFGTIDETLQGNIPVRVGAQQDMYWNGLAAAMGLWVVVMSLRPVQIKSKSGHREATVSLTIIALCLPVQGYFNLDVAQFGHLINDPERLVTFRSRSAPEELQTYDDKLDDFKKLSAQLGRVRMVELLPQVHDRTHEEALVHIFRRGYHNRLGHNFIVFKEDLIIDGYFHQFVESTMFDYPRERSSQLSEALADTAAWPYESPVAEHLITKFSSAQMWLVIAMLEAGILAAIVRIKRKIPSSPLRKRGP
jgi:hypothetical protein